MSNRLQRTIGADVIRGAPLAAEPECSTDARDPALRQLESVQPSDKVRIRHANVEYLSGEEIQAGYIIRYHGEPGRVEFVVTHKVGDTSLDWFIETFPGGGAMIAAQRFGNVFWGLENLDEDDLEFVSRCAAGSKG